MNVKRRAFFASLMGALVVGAVAASASGGRAPQKILHRHDRREVLNIRLTADTSDFDRAIANAGCEVEKLKARLLSLDEALAAKNLQPIEAEIRFTARTD